MNDKECDLIQVAKVLGTLFLLSFLNSIFGNYFILFLLVNGFFAYNYLYANKKDLLDKTYAKVNDTIQKVVTKIPKYEDN